MYYHDQNDCTNQEAILKLMIKTLRTSAIWIQWRRRSWSESSLSSEWALIVIHTVRYRVLTLILRYTKDIRRELAFSCIGYTSRTNRLNDSHKINVLCMSNSLIVIACLLYTNNIQGIVQNYKEMWKVCFSYFRNINRVHWI